jgi:hypothetical protein
MNDVPLAVTILILGFIIMGFSAWRLSNMELNER